MANISAADVKRLREQTGAGMMDCKNALAENDGDFSKAVEYLRVKGLKGITKREGRATSNGLVTAHVADGVGTLVEVNCETDFVAKSDPFAALGEAILASAVRTGAVDADVLLRAQLDDGRSVQQLIDESAATIGEKLQLRRVARLESANVSLYLHRTNPDLPPQIGVLVGTDVPMDVARDVAMHIAAMSPLYLTRDEVPAEVVANERRIAEETAREEGKPEQALPRIVEGRVGGFYKENVLLEQSFAKDSKKTVKQVFAEAKVTPTGFVRFRVGA
ncbi:MAG: Elongation factor Ts [Actinomycetota bacterium]|nr:Elongation factor Ts [Actinomycetota bacterium]